MDLPERLAPPANAAFRGEVQRFLLDTLRKVERPLTTFDMTEAVMRSRGLDTVDRLLFQLIAKRTGHSLSKLRRQGKVPATVSAKRAAGVEVAGR